MAKSMLDKVHITKLKTKGRFRIKSRRHKKSVSPRNR